MHVIYTPYGTRHVVVVVCPSNIPLNPGLSQAHPVFGEHPPPLIHNPIDAFHVHEQLLLEHASVVLLPVVVDPVVVLPVVVDDAVVVLPVVVEPVVVLDVVVDPVVVLPVVVDPVVVDPVVVLVLVVVLVVVGVSTSGSSVLPQTLRPHQTVPVSVGIASANR
jgi:hypothetical protein